MDSRRSWRPTSSLGTAKRPYSTERVRRKCKTRSLLLVRPAPLTCPVRQGDRSHPVGHRLGPQHATGNGNDRRRLPAARVATLLICFRWICMMAGGTAKLGPKTTLWFSTDRSSSGRLYQEYKHVPSNPMWLSYSREAGRQRTIQLPSVCAYAYIPAGVLSSFILKLLVEQGPRRWREDGEHDAGLTDWGLAEWIR